MKKVLLLTFSIMSAIVFADDKEAIRQAQQYGADTQIEVTVVHEDGSPVAGAEVKGIFPSVWNRSRAKTNMVEVKTDAKGQATLREKSGGDVLITVSKEGYYNSQEVVYFNTGKPSCVKDGQWQPWGYPCKIMLKPKMFPRKLVTNWDLPSRVQVMIPGEPGDKIGFDLERIDWVAPHGNGVVADFFVSRQTRTEGLPKGIIRRQERTLSFPRATDGAYRVPLSTQSFLQTPYKADPNATYEKELHFWRDVDFYASIAKPAADALEKECLILRTRTVCDVSGKLISAHYTVIDAALIPWGCNDDEIQLLYFYNTTPNDLWLESEKWGKMKFRTLRGAKRW